MSILEKYCGFICIIGRPNVGKSTLINNLIGEKISIISKKPNTTRDHIFGIETKGLCQSIYIDTPGFNFKHQNINLTFKKFLYNTQLILFIVEGIYWNHIDEMILEKIKKYKTPIILIINKIDNIKNKNLLLPHMLFLGEKKIFSDLIPISAKYGENISIIKNSVLTFLKKEAHIFPKDYITNQSKDLFISEIIREKLTWFLGDELPYLATVKIKKLIKKIDIYDIYSIIFVNKISQKKIIIGKHGTKIKKIGIAARRDIEKFLKHKINLTLWVKTKNV